MKRRLRIQAAAMHLGPMAILAATLITAPPLSAVVLILAGVLAMSIADGWLVVQYLTTRRALVEVVRDCGGEGLGVERADYFDDLMALIPTDVLYEAFPAPTPRHVSEGCGSNHREANNDR